MRACPCSAACVAAIVSLAAPAPAPAGSPFTDPGVTVLHVLGDATATSTASFGWAVSELHDIDGDGVDDIIVGAPYYPSIGTSNGKAYVFSGATGNLIWSWRGTAGQLQGFSVADAGDIDGDGVHDILVGARGGGSVKGRVTVYSGATGAVIRTIIDNINADYFGFSVAGPGDVDGDGVPDIAVGAAGSTASQPGFIAVYSGADGHMLYKVNGDTNGGHYGSGIARLGDINHDGVPDIVVGARDCGPGARGRVYVLSGANGAPILPGLDPDPAGGVDLGWFFVATPGDINGDGVPDIYAGDFDDTANGGASGRAYVWSGADGSLLREFTGGANAGMGPGRGAGDQNNDGVPDLVVGSYTSSDGASGAGRIDVFSGLTGQTLRTIISTTEGEQFGFDAVGIGDTNGDCAPDLVVSAAAGNVVYVIAGTVPAVAGDVNADGRVNSVDLGTLLSAFGMSVAPGFPADFNHDGVVDTRDLGVLLSAFGSACP